MELPFELRRRIVAFLTGLPNVHDRDAQRALLFSAGLDRALQDEVAIGAPPKQFVELLVGTLLCYGTLQDGRSALDSVLKAAREYFGKDGQDCCDALLRELQTWRRAIELASCPPASETSALRYFLEIHNTGDAYHGTLCQAGSTQVRSLPDLQFRPEPDLSGADERKQLDAGQDLYTRIFGNVSRHEYHALHDAPAVEICLITHDERVARLPWHLLAHKGIFLAASGWSVTISHKVPAYTCELPASPRMLIVAPQPREFASARAVTHIEALENRLSPHIHRFSRGHQVHVAAAWEEFSESVKRFKPQIVYYYGHSAADEQEPRLLFADGKKRNARAIPVAEFARCLCNAGLAPCLVYLNCCSGDAGGIFRAGRRLAEVVPAAITNRTVAAPDALQEQALALWDSLLLRGMSPHKAVAALYSRMNAPDISLAEARRMTPVLHGHYTSWQANPPQLRDRLVHDPHWHLKIDRVTQFSVISTQTRQMLREQKPRSRAFVWYGGQGQGIELFHHRLNVELREDVSDTFLYEVRPEWPADFDNLHRSFSDMLLEAFAVNSLAEIPARIRSKTYGASGTQTLVYVRHQPVKSSKIMNLKRLKAYLEWWNSVFVPLLERQQFALLGVSFIVKNPPQFRKYILDVEQLHTLYLDQTNFRLLDEMEKIAWNDLLEFLSTHNIRLPLKRRDQVLQRILESTGGHYEHTVEELKNLVELAWDWSEEDEREAKEVEEEYDY